MKGGKYLQCSPVKNMQAVGFVLTTLQSPCQNTCVQRPIGSIRRECLAHLIYPNEAGLRVLTGTIRPSGKLYRMPSLWPTNPIEKVNQDPN
jgi:hypothetical protein